MKGLRGILRADPGQSVHFSTSSVLRSRKVKRRPKYVYPNVGAFRANNWVVNRRQHPDLYEGQMQRKQWDYPLGDDQRASWKHWRWYDQFYRRWVDMTPKPPMKDFDVNYKEKRRMIHDQDTIQMKFALLLDKDHKKKYIVPPLNMEFPRNLSYFYQYLTKTKFAHGLPHGVESTPIEASELEEFEQFLTCILQMELKHNTKTADEKNRKQRADRIIEGIVRYLMASHAHHPDFEDCTLDMNPENHMYWQRGRGFHKYDKPPLPFGFQSRDVPLYQIRTKNRLAAFSPWMENFMLSGDIPECDRLPYVYGADRKLYRNMISPGFRHKGGDILLNYDVAWKERQLANLPPPVYDPHPFGHTQFISMPEKFSKQWYESNLEHCDITDQIEEHVKGHGIMSGWTWSAAQAHYQGHWMDNDVQNPYCVQTVVSDGSHFAFFCYQLNTVAIDPDNAATNERRNLCYGTPFMKLYDIMEGSDDIILHQDTTKLFLKFIKNSSSNISNKEDCHQHDNGLELQKWNSDNPHIELQTPKHALEMEAAREIARQAEIEKNKKLIHKVIDWVKK